MYRLSLALLWVGVATSAAIATTDAIYHLTDNARGLIIGAIVTATCLVGAILRIGLHELNQTAVINRGKSEELRDDVDRLRCQMDILNDHLGKVEALTKAIATRKAADDDNGDLGEQDAAIYQFRVRGRDGAEIIAGNRTREHVNTGEILAVLADS